MQDKSTRFTLAATGILLAALMILGWALSRSAAAKRGNSASQAPASQTAVPAEPLPPPAVSLKEQAPSIPLDARGKPIAQYQVITSTGLVEDSANDGDTFLIRTPDGPKRFSLYYADAVEPDGGQPESAREIAENFGFESEEPLRTLGVEARDFSLRLLRSTPFRVVTRWEEAPEPNSFYAFIFLKDPDQGLIDLSQWLVRYGLGMIRPCGRDCPDGTSAADYLERLRAEEARSQQESHGAWSRKP
ncbi:MAG: comEA [Verrucomicrobiales bacterium]|nr:comEA [Verrucomicrobiales bacterium]